MNKTLTSKYLNEVSHELHEYWHHWDRNTLTVKRRMCNVNDNILLFCQQLFLFRLVKIFKCIVSEEISLYWKWRYGIGLPSDEIKVLTSKRWKIFTRNDGTTLIFKIFWWKLSNASKNIIIQEYKKINLKEMENHWHHKDKITFLTKDGIALTSKISQIIVTKSCFVPLVLRCHRYLHNASWGKG